jgi:GTPase SAR1 family protein
MQYKMLASYEVALTGSVVPASATMESTISRNVTNDDDRYETMSPNTSTSYLAESTTANATTGMTELFDRFLQVGVTNLSHHNIHIPIICVMGDTSSGKSSLLSNLSLIELPSSNSLTTRCPIRLHMKRRGLNSPSFDHSLDNKGSGIGDTNTSNNGNTPCHVRQARITIEWKSCGTYGSSRPHAEFTERIIHDDMWHTIPDILKEAQDFILQQTGKDVAPDVISLVVESTEYRSDLTLIDLPGLVRSASGKAESQTLQKDTAALMEEYLNNPRCVILAMHASNVDWHNAQITAEAYRVDPKTCRTIPVLTKPDLIDAGAEHDVVDLLLGKKIEFSLGFHMIKGRGQAALDQKDTIEQGLYDEIEFFDTVDPWKSITDRSLFGTANLRKKLSDLQLNMIRKSLPDIIQEIRLKRNKASELVTDLGDLQESALDRRRYYQDLCQTLLMQMKSSLSGKGRTTTKPSAAARLHDACAEFMARIREGSLARVRSIEEDGQVLVTSPRGTVRGEVVHLDETFACVDFVDEFDKTSEVLFKFVGHQSDVPIEENDVWSDNTEIFIARKDNLYDSLKKIPLANIRTDPCWLKDRILQNRTDDLACFLNADIFKSIIQEFIEEDWKPHCFNLLEATQAILTATLKDAIEFTMSKINIKYPLLRLWMEQNCKNAVQTLASMANQQMMSQLEIEKHPYTQDSILFENLAKARYSTLQREFATALRLDQEGVVYDTQALQAILDNVFVRNQQKSVEDVMAEEMENVLESYGKIATRRMIDRTPMIAWDVFRSITTSIQDSLWNITDETLQQCMKESTEFATQYRLAKQEVDEMNQALEILESI